VKKTFWSVFFFYWATALVPFLSSANESSDLTPTETKVEKILQLTINSSINPATLNYLTGAYTKARKENYDLVLIHLNTPGGLVTTTKDILTLIGDSELPTAIWIKPEGASATSAGAIIAAGAHLLFMSEGTNIGAATPIQMGGDIEGKKEKKPDDSEEPAKKKSLAEEIQDQLKQKDQSAPKPDGSDMRAKAINDLVALVQSLSEARGRNPELFAEMIRSAASYKAREALEKNLIDALVNTDAELISALDQKTISVKGQKKILSVASPIVTAMPMDMGQRLLDIFANPSLAYILFMVGAALIYLEMQAPGGFIAGSVGATCLVLAGIGFQVLPVNFGALALITLSFLFFIMEIYVTSYGILSLAGLGALVSGSMFLYRTNDGYIDFGMSVVFSTVAAIVFFMGFIAFLFIKDRKKGQSSDFNQVIGHTASVMNELPSTEMGFKFYQVKVNGEIWRAKSSNTYALNTLVKVTAHHTDSHTLEIE